MALSRKDLIATMLTILVVLTYAATHEGWDVALIGDSHRWAAAVILLLGAGTCGLGDSQRYGSHKLAAALGIAALPLAALALATGSLTPLSLLVVDIVALWFIATAGHIAYTCRHGTVPT
jgi:hypothetical protein